MSITSSTSLAGGSNWGMSALHHRRRQSEMAPDLTKDQLSQMEQKMKANGKDTTNLDKIISNFDQLDANQDGKVGMDELKAGAKQLGIELPSGPPGKHHQPPALSKDQLSDITAKLKADGKDTTNLDKLIANFDQLDTDQNGKVGLDEVKAGAEKLGIDLPLEEGPDGPPGGPAAFASRQMEASWGPPPGLVNSDNQNASNQNISHSENQFLLKMLQSFTQSNPGISSISEDASGNHSVSVAA